MQADSRCARPGRSPGDRRTQRTLRTAVRLVLRTEDVGGRIRRAVYLNFLAPSEVQRSMKVR